MGRASGYDAVRVAAALLLLAAAGLKGWQLATGPVVARSILDARWFLIGVVECELFLGLWLLAGPFPRATWAAALACFGAFACVSLAKAVSGHASCGCFGRVAVSPWYTAALDLAIVAFLARWRPKRAAAPACGPARSAPTGVSVWGRPAAVSALFLLAGLPAAYAMGSRRDATLAELGDAVDNGRVVILNPGQWVGKRLPLLPYIDIGDDLTEGKWLAVLYRDGCPSCERALAELPRMARDAPAARVALVEMPPHARVRSDAAWPGAAPARGVLRDAAEWFAETPVVLTLEDGVVVEDASGSWRTSEQTWRPL